MKEILDKTTDVYEQWKVVPNNKAKNIKILQGVLSVYLSSKNYVLAKELYNNFIEKNENLNKFKS